MLNYTKGDWKVNKISLSRSKPDLFHIEIIHKDSGDSICDTVRKEADAIIMAASPLMVEELSEISAAIENLGSGIDHDSIKLSIDALLAKISGE